MVNYSFSACLTEAKLTELSIKQIDPKTIGAMNRKTEFSATKDIGSTPANTSLDILHI